jgi:hypothetical protein
MPPRETLTTAASRPISEALAARVVLAHPCTAFHPCTCGLYGGVAAVAAVLIGYDDRWGCCWKSVRKRRSWLTTSSTPTRDYIGSLLQLFFRCSACLEVTTIYDLLTCKFPVCNDRCSASVAYPLPFNGIKAVLRSFWSGSFVAQLWLDQSGLKRGGSWLCHVTKWLIRVPSLLCAWHVPIDWNHYRD